MLKETANEMRKTKLVLRFEDEHLSSAGLDLTALRTYNSQGEGKDGDGDMVNAKLP